MEALKAYFSMMVHGVDGKRMSTLAHSYPIEVSGSNAVKLASIKQRYLYLCQTMDKNEERLPLWLSMTQDQQLQMLAYQHIDGEFETMALLMLEELDKQPSSQYKMAELDRKLERALDYAIYEKYRRLAEWQAMKTTA